MSPISEIRPALTSDSHNQWSNEVASLFFEMEIDDVMPDSFVGAARFWDIGEFRLSRFGSSAATYRRLRKHCDSKEAQILISVPLVGTVEFEQFGRQIRCEPGSFLLEHSDAPYEFRYGERSDMWVVKVPEGMLQRRVGNISRFCAMCYDAKDGAGKLFYDYLRLMAHHAALGRAVLGEAKFQNLLASQCADLLAAVLESDPRILHSSGSAIKGAHLARIENYIKSHLSDADLSPEKVAGVCSISVRYLHLLFSESGRTLSSWIRELRLDAAHELLQRGGARVTVAQTAYQLGFSDHAQFSNAFRKQFGRSPSDVLRESREPVIAR